MQASIQFVSLNHFTLRKAKSFRKRALLIITVDNYQIQISVIINRKLDKTHLQLKWVVEHTWLVFVPLFSFSATRLQGHEVLLLDVISPPTNMICIRWLSLFGVIFVPGVQNRTNLLFFVNQVSYSIVKGYSYYLRRITPNVTNSTYHKVKCHKNFSPD